MIKLITYIYFILLSSNIFAQLSNYNSFAKTYTSLGNNLGNDACIDNQGNIYVVGNESALISNTNTDAYLYKINPMNFKIIWSVNILNNGIDILNGITFSAIDNSILIVGFDNNMGNYKPIIKKYNLNGTIIWTYTDNFNNNTFLQKVKTDNQGNVYATGFISGNGIKNNSAYLLKLNSNGIFIKEQIINNTENTYINDIKIIDDTIYSAGYAEDINDDKNYFALKLNLQLDTLSTLIEGLPNIDEVFLSCNYQNNQFICGGYYQQNGNKNPYVICLNNNLTKLWDYSYTSVLNDYLTSINYIQNKWHFTFNTESFGFGSPNNYDVLYHNVLTNGGYNFGTTGITNLNEEIKTTINYNDSCIISIGSTNAKLKKAASSLFLLKQNIFKSIPTFIDSINTIAPNTNSIERIAKKNTYITYSNQSIFLKNKEYLINKIIIFDITGKEILKINNINKNNIEIDIHIFNNGLYIIHLIDDFNTLEKIKFVKNNY